MKNQESEQFRYNIEEAREEAEQVKKMAKKKALNRMGIVKKEEVDELINDVGDKEITEEDYSKAHKDVEATFPTREERKELEKETDLAPIVSEISNLSTNPKANWQIEYFSVPPVQEKQKEELKKLAKEAISLKFKEMKSAVDATIKQTEEALNNQGVNGKYEADYSINLNNPQGSSGRTSDPNSFTCKFGLVEIHISEDEYENRRLDQKTLDALIIKLNSLEKYSSFNEVEKIMNALIDNVHILGSVVKGSDLRVIKEWMSGEQEVKARKEDIKKKEHEVFLERIREKKEKKIEAYKKRREEEKRGAKIRRAEENRRIMESQGVDEDAIREKMKQMGATPLGLYSDWGDLSGPMYAVKDKKTGRFSAYVKAKREFIPLKGPFSKATADSSQELARIFKEARYRNFDDYEDIGIPTGDSQKTEEKSSGFSLEDLKNKFNKK